MRLDIERRDRGLAATGEIAEVMAPLLGWSRADVEAERAAYARRVAEIGAAEAETTDADAVARLSRRV